MTANTANTKDAQRLKAYFLGQLTEEETLELETELFVDEDLCELQEDIKQELMTAYLADRLSLADRQRFETYFLRSRKRREELEFTRALYQVSGEYLKALAPAPLPTIARSPVAVASASATPVVGAPSAQASFGARLAAWWQSLALTPQFGLAAAACSLLLISGLAWLAWRNTQLQGQIEQERQARAALEQQGRQTAAEVQNLSKENNSLQDLLASLSATEEGPDKPIIDTFNLVPASATDRGQGGSTPPQKLTLNAQADVTRLRFDAFKRDEYAQYQVIIRRGTETVWGPRRLTLKSPQQKRLSITLPGNLLKPGNYTLVLSGIGEDGKPADGIGFELTITRK